MKKELEQFLHRNVYRHTQLVTMRQRAQSRVKQMYSFYCDNPDWIPAKYRPRADQVGVKQMAIEYIAGMTDHFCDETYRKMFSSEQGSIAAKV